MISTKSTPLGLGLNKISLIKISPGFILLGKRKLLEKLRLFPKQSFSSFIRIPY